MLRQVLRTAEFTVEDRDTVLAAVHEFESGASDFADCPIAHRNHARGCARTHTFDRRAARGNHFALVT